MPETIDDRRSLALRAAEIEELEVMGRRIVAVRDESGRKWNVVKRACEAMGVSFQGQVAKLTRDGSQLRIKMILIPDSRGILQDTLCIDYDDTPAWIAGINPNKVDQELRPQLEAFARKVVEVIRDAFIPLAARNDKSQSGTLAPRIDVDAIATAVADRVMAHVDSRLVVIENKTDRALQAATTASEQAVKAQSSCISAAEFRMLRLYVSKIVSVLKLIDPCANQKSLFGLEYAGLAQNVSWSGKGKSFENLPRDKWGLAKGYLECRLKDVQRQYARVPSSQVEMFGGAA